MLVCAWHLQVAAPVIVDTTAAAPASAPSTATERPKNAEAAANPLSRVIFEFATRLLWTGTSDLQLREREMDPVVTLAAGC